MANPTLRKSIPTQIVNVRAAFGPINLIEYIEADANDGKLKFSAELEDGKSLPTGMIITEDGILTGIPAKGTEGTYPIVVYAKNDGGSVTLTFDLTIKPSMNDGSPLGYLDEIKPQIWQALENKLPIPDLSALYEQNITALEIYYLLERWGILTIWDAFNLESPSDKHEIQLEGQSEHYVIYDRVSCLVAAPKDLFSHERTIEDGLQTARAMAREVYKRGWTIELTGFDKLSRAAWIEIQHLIDKHGKQLEVINYKPSMEDMKLYQNQALVTRLKGKME